MASSCLLIVVYLSLLISHFATTTSLPFCDSNQLGQALIKILHQSVPTHFDLKLTEEEVAFYRYHFDYYCNHFATMTTGIVVQNCLLITLEIKRLAYYPSKCLHSLLLCVETTRVYLLFASSFAQSKKTHFFNANGLHSERLKETQYLLEKIGKICVGKCIGDAAAAIPILWRVFHLLLRYEWRISRSATQTWALQLRFERPPQNEDISLDHRSPNCSSSSAAPEQQSTKIQGNFFRQKPYVA